MFMIFHARPSHRPWLIGIFALALLGGVLALLTVG